ncbi:MAG: hypothetical protein BGO63_10455 [Candidatus Accumulibacter sp. 66-26]|nr:hypothetical protein [Accumulibacter sp.]OJW51544.1 MAG: hypothetical protein BGO63_10455 [Candidatus Accumulibacter sp. 66-26]
MDIEKLKAAGFVETTYPDQEGVFLTKRTRVDALPRAGANFVDNDFICGDSEAITEMFPDGGVQLHIPDGDYVEGPYAASSVEAAALLNDAIAASSA